MRFYANINAIPGLAGLEPSLQSRVWQYALKRAHGYWLMWLIEGLSLLGLVIPIFVYHAEGVATVSAIVGGLLWWLVATNLAARHVDEGLKLHENPSQP